MSNTSNGKANKGSKMQMQRITAKKNQHILNEILSDKLIWLAPIEEDNYREYQLNNAKIIKLLGLPKGIFKGFWPSRQPQWDGIAISEKKVLYLFEAKSHLSEIQSSKSKKQELIRMRIDEVANEIAGIKPGDDCKRNLWYHNYYQIANRIVFKEKMQGLAEISTVYKKVVLVFLNFVNDTSWKDSKKMVKSSTEWEEHYIGIFKEMGIDKDSLQSRNIYINYFDVENLV